MPSWVPQRLQSRAHAPFRGVRGHGDPAGVTTCVSSLLWPAAPAQCASGQCLDCSANFRKCKKCMDGAVGTGQRGFGVNAAGGCSLVRPLLR